MMGLGLEPGTLQGAWDAQPRYLEAPGALEKRFEGASLGCPLPWGRSQCPESQRCLVELRTHTDEGPSERLNRFSVEASLTSLGMAIMMFVGVLELTIFKIFLYLCSGS